MSLPVAIGSWVVGLGVLAVILSVVALVDIFGKRSHLDQRQRWAWILVIVLLPIVGSTLYLVQRPR